MLFFSFIKLNINTKLAFDSSAECFVAQVSRWWGSSSRWLKPKGGCCRQPQVSVLLLRVMWMGWCWAGLSRREAAVVEEVSLCIFAHPLDAHLCTYAHSQSVWKFLLGSLCSTASTSQCSPTDWAPVCWQRQLHCSSIPPTFGIN